MIKEFCKRHKVDYTGTLCGACAELWRKHSLELKRLKKKIASLRKTLDGVK